VTTEVSKVSTLHPGSKETAKDMRVLIVGRIPETVDYSDPALPPGLNAEKIYAGIDVAAAKIAEKGWLGDICNIAPDDDCIARLEKQLASTAHDCVVVGGGLRLPPKGR
jgi:hypothetical protein